MTYKISSSNLSSEPPAAVFGQKRKFEEPRRQDLSSKQMHSWLEWFSRVYMLGDGDYFYNVITLRMVPGIMRAGKSS